MQNQPKQEEQEEQEKKISYSELKIWNECAYKHKLVYIDKEPYFTGNHFTAFGTAVHTMCEHVVTSEALPIFEEVFNEELNKLETEVESETIRTMLAAGEKIIPEVAPELDKVFGEYEVFSVEEQLMENIDDFESHGKKFKGYIDLVIKTKDGKYHIIDWKTCSWGWDARRRSDKMTNYQLVLYKKFFALKHDIDPAMIETYFGLLKRTAKNNFVEIFRTSSGKERSKNAVKLLERAIVNINKNIHIKNKLSCKGCHFFERCNGDK